MGDGVLGLDRDFVFGREVLIIFFERGEFRFDLFEQAGERRFL